MPASKENQDKSGFTSRKKAWEWIGENGICKSCKESLDRGYELWTYIDENGKEVKERREIKNAGWTMCGAEWLVMKEEDYNNAESTDDLFRAGGYKKVYNKNEEV